MANKTAINPQKKTKQPAGAPPQVVLQMLDIRKWTRTEQDIPKWRNAIKSFEAQNPRRRLLYNLYADVMLDGHVESVVSKRQDAVTAANWQFVDQEGKPVDEINDLIDSIGFDELVREIVNAKFWGYSILEPRFWRGVDDSWEMSAGLLPRLHYFPEKGIVSRDSVGDDGVNIRQGVYLKTVMEVGNINDMGLLVKAAPYQILKRGGVGDWAGFIQTFGSPIIDAVWDGMDEKQRTQLKEAFNEMGAGGQIIRPNGTEVTIIENKAKDTGDAHGNFNKFLNTEISKALLGTTETTEASNSSGYAQSKTHQEQDDDKHENDLTYVRKYLNSRFIRVLQAYGFDTQKGYFIVQAEEAGLSKKEAFEIHSKIVSEHQVPVNDDFWYETYDLPKPDNYDQLKAEQKEAAKTPEPTDPEPKSKRQKTKAKRGKKQVPDGDEGGGEEEEIQLTNPRTWPLLKTLAAFFVKAPQDGAACAHHTIELSDGQQLDNEALLKRVWTAGGTLTEDKPLFDATAKILEDGFALGWKTAENMTLADKFSFEYGNEDPEYFKSFINNIFKFTGTKVTALLKVLNQLFRESTTFEEFYAAAINEVETYNRNYLEAEYTTAVLTGEAASTYKRLKTQADIFPYWIYRTAGDNLVRNAHRLLEGMVLPHDDPAWENIYPPNGWRCRCYVLPRMAHEVTAAQLELGKKLAKQYLDSPAFEKEKKAGWAGDRMGEGFVFGEDQMYKVSE